MNQVTTIDRLVEVSEEATLPVRKNHKVLPEQVSQTFIQHAQELHGTGRSLDTFKQKEKFGLYLHTLANFPILKGDPLVATQLVTLGNEKDDMFTATLPLFGICPMYGKMKENGYARDKEYGKEILGPLTFGVRSNVVRNSSHGNAEESVCVQFWWSRSVGGKSILSPFPDLPQQFPFKSEYETMFAIGMMGAVAKLTGGFKKGLHGAAIIQNIPQIPRSVLGTIPSVQAYGFTDLCVVWGPATYGFDEKAFKDDPLLIGYMFNTWWILDQWGMTDTEKKLMSTTED